MSRAAAPLAALALGLLAACGAASSADREPPVATDREAPRVTTIAAGALADRLAAGEVMLIDVRTPEEFAEGRIAGAINVPLDSFDPARLPQAGSREIVLYCRSDRRSGIAADRLAAATGRPAVHLEGGILAWEAAQLPVER